MDIIDAMNGFRYSGHPTLVRPRHSVHGGTYGFAFPGLQNHP